MYIFYYIFRKWHISKVHSAVTFHKVEHTCVSSTQTKTQKMCPPNAACSRCLSMKDDHYLDLK